MNGLDQAPHLVDVPLIDHLGNDVSLSEYRGGRILLYFGFTNCQSVCPQALARTTAALNLLPPEDRPRFLFVTVDPLRDDPATLQSYLRLNAPLNTVGLTGGPEAITELTQAARVHVHRRERPNLLEGYDTPHTSFTYLFDSHGDYETHFGLATPAEEMAHRLMEPH